MTTTPTNDPAPASERPQAAPSPEALAALQADFAAGRITMPDFLTRLAEMQAAFLGG